ncbi:MAG: hypothetical protein VB100_07680 [Angelakisella sp.]|nr:hypothetical protein [Angelakisella sp.]
MILICILQRIAKSSSVIVEIVMQSKLGQAPELRAFGATGTSALNFIMGGKIKKELADVKSKHIILNITKNEKGQAVGVFS